MSLTLQSLPGVPLVQAGDDIVKIICEAINLAGIQPANGDIFILAQKIISKSEGRLINLTQIDPSPEAVELAFAVQKDPRFVELVLRESSEVLRTRAGTIIVEHKRGFVCANAGIDHSNVSAPWGDPQDWVLLLPEDADQSAATIRSGLELEYGVKLGVLIIDSHGRAWRNGTVGMTIGLSGVPGVVDLRGERDLFGYRLRITQVAAADELAAAAALLIGETSEGTPIVFARGFPYPLREANIQELLRAREEDLFR